MSQPSQIQNLSLRGTLTENAPLGADSWFGCGGAADLLFVPANIEDLQSFLSQYDGDITILGGMANTIVRDGGVRGCVIRLGKGIASVDVSGDTITAGAGALNGTLAAAAAKNGIGGFEFFSGIPGTVGGALRMNAGAYGAEVKDVLLEAHALDRRGNLHVFTPADLHMSYRHTELPDGYIFIRAILRGQAEDTQIVRERLKDIKTKRQSTQPIAEKTGGSTFANPDEAKAWELVDRAGARGLKIGGAQMSEKHCNFMINTGEATASDLENLGDEVIRLVREKTGITLRWEINRIGDYAKNPTS